MRKLPLLVLSALFGVSLASNAAAGVDVHINLGVPPPPTVVFESEPNVVLVPRTRVYYVPGLDYDLYRYGDNWYVNRDGYWYRSSSYRGPFAPVVYERVPRSIVVIPRQYHHHPLRPVRDHPAPSRHAPPHRGGYDDHRRDGDHRGHDDHHGPGHGPRH